MSDVIEDFRAIREHNRQERANRRENGRADIEALADLPDPSGDDDIMRYSVDDLNNGMHFRIDDALDLFPTNYRFHNLKTGERGFYPSRPQKALTDFVDRQIKRADEVALAKSQAKSRKARRNA